ncbi:MAG: cytochrome c oxidase subunit II transmembrane domain-containing protein [Planctomycetota bacterium]
MDTTSLNLLAEVRDGGLWFPTDASASNQVDSLTFFILIICAIFILFNAGLMVFFAIRYRQKQREGSATGATHNTALEVTWSVIPAFILAVIFIWGFRGYLVQATPPDNSYDIMVTGYKWGWDFTYPNGANSKAETRIDPATGKKVTMPPALHVPSDTPIRLTLQSNDVLHSVFIKQLRVKKDCVPGRFNQMWFEANWDDDPENIETVELPTKEGNTVTAQRNTYDLFCTEYCGQNHSMMITKVYVYQPDDYKKWYESVNITPVDKPVIEIGQTIWETQCKACHSLDGSAGTGPTWKDLYGDTAHATSAGSINVDDAYIIESIRNPGAIIVDGYGNNMAAFPNLSDREIRGVIEFMKTISDKVEANEDLVYGDLNPDGTLKSESGEEGAEEGAEPGDETESPEGGAAAEDEYQAVQ